MIHDSCPAYIRPIIISSPFELHVRHPLTFDNRNGFKLDQVDENETADLDAHLDCPPSVPNANSLHSLVDSQDSKFSKSHCTYIII